MYREEGLLMTENNSDTPLRGFVKFKPLVGVDSSRLAACFDQMTKSLHGTSFSGTARFTLVGEPRTQSFTISLQAGSATLEGESARVDFEIITTPETWLAIAEGKLSVKRLLLCHASRFANPSRLSLSSPARRRPPNSDRSCIH